MPGIERIKARDGDMAIFTPLKISKLLGVASSEFLPSIAIGAFAGLPSAEMEGLTGADVGLCWPIHQHGSAEGKDRFTPKKLLGKY